MTTIEHEVKNRQPEVYEEIIEIERIEEDRLTKFFRRLEEILDPVVRGLWSVRNEW